MIPEPSDQWLRVVHRSACYCLAFRAGQLAYGAPYGLAIVRKGKLPRELNALRRALEQRGARCNLLD